MALREWPLLLLLASPGEEEMPLLNPQHKCKEGGSAGQSLVHGAAFAQWWGSWFPLWMHHHWQTPCTVCLTHDQYLQIIPWSLKGDMVVGGKCHAHVYISILYASYFIQHHYLLMNNNLQLVPVNSQSAFFLAWSSCGQSLTCSSTQMGLTADCLPTCLQYISSDLIFEGVV